MLRVKICGLTTPQDAAAAIEAGADALGFNFFPGSRRYVEPSMAGEWIAELPTHIDKIAILVNPSWDEAMTVASMAGITALQLHGVETPDFCGRLSASGVSFAKAVPVSGAGSVLDIPNFHTNTLLLDSAEGQFGGSGKSLPWLVARDFVSARPDLRVILAGGLTAENVAEAVALVRPFGVDVTSGVESSPGRKDHDRMRDFIAAARGD
jgi:phosphoribosylanthranilate isomerase